MNDIMKVVKSCVESGLLIKEVSQTVENEAEEQKVDFSVHIRCYFIRKSINK